VLLIGALLRRAEGAQISYEGYRKGLVLDVGGPNAPGAGQLIRHREGAPIGRRRPRQRGPGSIIVLILF
jgi:hypothetical protein